MLILVQLFLIAYLIYLESVCFIFYSNFLVFHQNMPFLQISNTILLPQFTCFNLTKQANNEKLQKRLHEYYINLSEDEKIKK